MHLKRAADATLSEIEAEFSKLEEEARHRLAEEGVAPDDMHLQRAVEMRYVGQWRQLAVDIGSERLTELDSVLDSFHSEHARAYSFEDRERMVEIYSLRVVARGTVPKPKPTVPSGETSDLPDPAHRRAVHFGAEHGFVDTPVYRREALGPGMVLDGPTVIEQLDSTLLLPPGTRSQVTTDLHIVMKVA
jgi:N-methylhydantoinase A